MGLNLKFTATKIDEIEKIKGTAIENCVSDNSINGIATILQKSLVDDNGIHGVSRAVAISTIDKYLEDKDKDDLVLDIVEALVRDGFLSRQLDVQAMRDVKTKKAQELKNTLAEM